MQRGGERESKQLLPCARLF